MVRRPRGKLRAVRSTEAAKALGFPNYSAYLRSNHWRSFRRQFKAHRSWTCICGEETGLELHHCTYENLAEEDFGDVIALCGPCHASIHEGGELDPDALDRLIRASRYSESRSDHSPEKLEADEQRKVDRKAKMRRRPEKPGPASRLSRWEAEHQTPVPRG